MRKASLLVLPAEAFMTWKEFDIAPGSCSSPKDERWWRLAGARLDRRGGVKNARQLATRAESSLATTTDCQLDSLSGTSFSADPPVIVLRPGPDSAS